MSHLQPQLTEKMRGWKVETRDAGICYVPGDVVSAPHILALNTPLERIDDADIFELLQKRLADYVEGRYFEDIEVIDGYFFRLSAPGYLDCTEWDCRHTLKAAQAALKELTDGE